MAFGRAELLESVRALAHIGQEETEPGETALNFEFSLMEVARGRYACLSKAERDAVTALYAHLEPFGIENEKPELWTRDALIATPEWDELRALATQAVRVFETK